MDDLAFRQAMAYVIDKEAIIDSVPEGSGIARYTIVSPELRFWYTDDVNTWGRGMSQPERLEEAVTVLADAGYTWTTPPQAVKDDSGAYTGEIINGEGLTQPDGTPVPTIGLLTPIHSEDRLRQVQGEWITRFAATLGITIDWQPTDFDAIEELVFPPTADGTGTDVFDPFGWDLHTLGWGGTNPLWPCESHQALFDADNDVVTGRGSNAPGYNNPEFQTLSDAFDGDISVDEARSICADMERHIADNLPYIVLWTNPLVEAWRSHIELPYTQVYAGTVGWPDGLFGQVKIND
jgi:ABC-type transport system substrate-binding protein